MTTQLPFDPTVYSFVLQQCLEDEYTYTRPDNYILVINPVKQLFLIRYYNINNPGVNIELFNNGYCNPEGKIENIKTKEIVEGCGCNLSAKVFCKECSCPANKW